MPARRPNISEAEWEVMEALWSKSPLTAGEVIDTLAEKTSWAPNTVRTLLTRLVRKKILEADKRNGPITFRPSPKLSREECVGQESASFLDRVFGGSAQPLLLHFAAKAKLSPEEVRELQRILKEKGKQS